MVRQKGIKSMLVFGRGRKSKEVVEPSPPLDRHQAETQLAHALKIHNNENAVLDALEQVDDVDLLLERGRTPLHLAAIHGYDQVARDLIHRGANIEAIDAGSWTPLHLASAYGSLEVVVRLLNAGALVDAEDDESWTALHQAVSQKHVYIARKLLENGAEPKVRTKDDRLDVFERVLLDYSKDELSKFRDVFQLVAKTTPTLLAQQSRLESPPDPEVRANLDAARELRLQRRAVEKRAAERRSYFDRTSHAVVMLQRLGFPPTSAQDSALPPLYRDDQSLLEPTIRPRYEKRGQPVSNSDVGESAYETSSTSSTRPEQTRNSLPRNNSYSRRLASHEIALATQNQHQYSSLRENNEAWQCYQSTSRIRLISFDDEVYADDQLIVRLEEHAQTSASYVAISYVWGEPDLTHKVLCKKGTSHLKVTARLYNIMSILRLQGHMRLWIDAICINQENVFERNHQVQQMAAIYRRAESVRVFLNTRSLTPEAYIHSDWWSRRWVIQEVVSAAMVYVNSNNASDPMSTTLDEVADTCLEYAQRHRHEHDPQALATLSKVQELHHLRKKHPGTTSIFTHLLHFHDTECKDPRDRLYSFFGISQGDLDALPAGTRWVNDEGSSKQRPGKIKCEIDYEKSVQEVYTQFAIAALQSANPMDILHCAGAFTSNEQDSLDHGSEPWPSWIPDWRAPRRYHPLMRAARYTSPLPIPGTSNIRIDVTSMTLTITGFRIGIVVDTNPRHQEDETRLPREFFVNHVRSGSIDLYLDRVIIDVNIPGVGVRQAFAPLLTQVGDIVVIFATARTPFILRNVGSTSFRLICDCYLPSAMVGRDEQPPKAAKIEKFTVM